MPASQNIPASCGFIQDKTRGRGASWRQLALVVTAAALATALFLPLTPARAEPLPGLVPPAAAVQKAGDSLGAAKITPVWGERNVKHRHPHRGKPRVPAVCAIEIGGRDDVKVYSGNCMERQGLRARLPRDCAAPARIFGARDKVYGERCLKKAGYDLPR